MKEAGGGACCHWPASDSFCGQVCGYRLRLHFDGYSECHDFWVNANSPDIHPAGWFEKTGHKLQPPKGKISLGWSLEDSESQSHPLLQVTLQPAWFFVVVLFCFNPRRRAVSPSCSDTAPSEAFLNPLSAHQVCLPLAEGPRGFGDLRPACFYFIRGPHHGPSLCKVSVPPPLEGPRLQGGGVQLEPVPAQHESSGGPQASVCEPEPREYHVT